MLPWAGGVGGTGGPGAPHTATHLQLLTSHPELWPGGKGSRQENTVHSSTLMATQHWASLAGETCVSPAFGQQVQPGAAGRRWPPPYHLQPCSNAANRRDLPQLGLWQMEFLTYWLQQVRGWLEGSKTQSPPRLFSRMENVL